VRCPLSLQLALLGGPQADDLIEQGLPN
jgi:hypothetical protein